MGGGGGKGGESKQSIDPKLTAAAKDALDFGAAAAAIPYSPNRGIQFAAFTPQQEAGMTAANDAAAAFGLPTATGSPMPAAETSASGIKGYSTSADYDEMKDASMSEGLQAALAALFADPETGAFNGPGGPLYKGSYSGRRGSGVTMGKTKKKKEAHPSDMMGLWMEAQEGKGK